MTLNQLYYFQCVARTENFRAAAEDLYISQPSLSRSIDSLEKELGIMLFERSGIGISLTKAGTLFLEYVCMLIMDTGLGINFYIATVITAVIVVVANYLFSKLIVFRNKKEKTP